METSFCEFHADGWSIEATRYAHERSWQLTAAEAGKKLPLVGAVTQLRSSGSGYVWLQLGFDISPFGQVESTTEEIATRIQPAVHMHLFLGAVMAAEAATVEILTEGPSINRPALIAAIEQTGLEVTEDRPYLYVPAKKVMQKLATAVPPDFEAFGKKLLAQSSSSR